MITSLASSAASQNRRGIIRSAAAERGGNAFRCRRNVAGDDGNAARFEHGKEGRLRFLPRRLGQRTRAAVHIVGHNQIGRVKRHAAKSHFAQHGGGDSRGEPLARAGDHIQRAGREFAEQRAAAAIICRAFDQRVDFGEQFPPRFDLEISLPMAS
jgi:hypothetical protein